MMKNSMTTIACTLAAAAAAVSVAAVAGCEQTPCTVTENEDGSSTITCPDGSTATIAGGAAGAAGAAGADGADGADGTDGVDGVDGVDGGELLACGGEFFEVDQLGLLAGCEEIVGGAVILIDETSDVSALGSLQRVHGSLTIVVITDDPTFALTFPALTSIDEEFVVVTDEEPIARLSLPTLTAVARDFSTFGIAAVEAPSLLGVSVIELSQVNEVTLSSLRRANDLEISSDGALELELSATAQVNFVRITAPDASGCLIPALPSIVAACEQDSCELDLLSNEGASCDNCPDIVNNDQSDIDRDGDGDVCDGDIDGDTVINADDLQPTISTVCRDSDSDGCDDCANGAPNPADDGADTDGDGVCDDSVPEACTLRGSALVCGVSTAAGSAALCASLGLTLPVFHNDGDQQALVDDIGNIEYWIGLNDTAVEGTFVWADGTTFDFETESNFNDGEPNNSNNEDCVEAFGNNRWNDLQCGDTRGTVCPLSPSFNGRTDNCVDDDNADQADGDGDGVGNVCDNCVGVANADQADDDDNGVGNACEV